MCANVCYIPIGTVNKSFLRTNNKKNITGLLTALSKCKNCSGVNKTRKERERDSEREREKIGERQRGNKGERQRERRNKKLERK